MSTPSEPKPEHTGGNEPSPPPPGSPPDEGVAVTGGDPTAPAYEGHSEINVDPPIPESERPRASDT